MYKPSVFIKHCLGCRNAVMLCQTPSMFTHLDKAHMLAGSAVYWCGGQTLCTNVFSVFTLPDEDGWLLSGLTECLYWASWCWGISCIFYDLLGNTDECAQRFVFLKWDWGGIEVPTSEPCRWLYLHLLISSFHRFVDQTGGIDRSVLDPFLVTIISGTNLFD